ncbi:MAG: hypothetical protein MJ238_02765 [Bacilli bacterium]|nr:hypothetical protein [Bacilli bacterium]
MKYKLIRFILASLSGFPLASATITTNETGVFLDTIVNGVPEGDAPYTFTLKFKGKKIGYHSFYIVWNNEITKSTPAYQNDSSYPGSYVVRNTTWSRIKISYAQSITLDVSIPRSMIANTMNRLSIYNAEYKDATYGESSLYARTIILDTLRPTTYSLNLTNYKFTEARSGFAIKDGSFVNAAYSFESEKMLPPNYITPDKNKVPFHRIKMRCHDFAGQTVTVPYKTCVLKVFNELDKFSHWNTKTDGITKWVEIPLKLKATDDGWWRPCLKTLMGVTPDGRTMKSLVNMKTGDLYTDEIFLPAVDRTGETVFQMQLLFTGSGATGIDTIKYDFTITKEANLIGSCASSIYCLEEV